MPILIENDAQLHWLAAELGNTGVYYLDTEFDSRASGTTLCLIQLREQDEVYLIDSLALRDLSLLSDKLGDPRSTWVLHGGHQDVPLLRRSLGLAGVPSVFDTQIAWALSSPEPAASLSYLSFKLLGVRSSKHHQSDDWSRRPLTHSQLAYAAHDVEALPQLHAILSQRLADLGRERIARVACQEFLCEAVADWEPLALESFRTAWQLEPVGQRALSELIEWYNSMSTAERVRAPDAKLLWPLANRLPKSVDTLRQVRGLPRNLSPDHQQRILSIMRNAARADNSSMPVLLPPPYATFERLQLDAWLEYVRCVACAKVQVAKELAVGGPRLRRLRETVAKAGLAAFNSEELLESIGEWRFELLGEALRWATTRVTFPTLL